MPGFTDRERDAMVSRLKEIGTEAIAHPRAHAIIPFTEAMREVLVTSLFAATKAAVESAKAYTKELNDERAQITERRARLNAHRLTELEKRVRELEQKAN